MKEDEKRFLIDVYNKCRKPTGEMIKLSHSMTFEYKYRPRDLINEPEFYMNYKRAWYILEKWCSKGIYEYGVTLDLGWLTDEGKAIAEGLIKQAR